MGSFGFGLGEAMFTVIPILIFLGFIVMLGLIIGALVRAAKQKKKNDNSPVLTVDATVVTKRTNVTHYHHNNTGTNDFSHTSTSTTYYATFEVESGDRMEFEVYSTEYGMLVERDRGKLKFQGTRYLGFERI